MFASFTDATLERDEWAGWDNLQTTNGTARFVLRWNVAHDVYAHFRYDDWTTDCARTSPGWILILHRMHKTLFLARHE